MDYGSWVEEFIATIVLIDGWNRMSVIQVYSDSFSELYEKYSSSGKDAALAARGNYGNRSSTYV